MLRLKLSGLQETAARMAEAAYLKGEAADNFHKVKNDIAFLPELIIRADHDVQNAVDRLTEHQARAPNCEAQEAIDRMKDRQTRMLNESIETMPASVSRKARAAR